VDFNASNFWDVFLWSLFFFIWICAIFVWVRVIFDMFSDSSLGGFAKALWAIALVFVPWLSAFIYLIARGKSMAERQMKQVAQAQAAQTQYIKDVAGTATSPAEQIKHAKELLDSGAISQQEFDALKAKALA
jgi:type VI protein secretion system component VasK